MEVEAAAAEVAAWEGEAVAWAAAWAEGDTEAWAAVVSYIYFNVRLAPFLYPIYNAFFKF